MCGIAGYYCFGSKRPTYDEIADIHRLNEVRGGTASGLGYFDSESGEFVMTKAPVGAADFHELKSVKRWLSDPLPNHMIMHTRMPTQGSAANNDNNHPVFYGEWLVVHNGCISNDYGLFEEFKAKRLAEVDSEAIPMTLHHAKTIPEALSIIDGSWAIAALLKPVGDVTPGLLLARNSSPLAILIDLKRDILFWSSTDEPLKKTVMRKDAPRMIWHGVSLETKDTRFHLFELARDHYLTFSHKQGLLKSEPVKFDRVKAPSSYRSGYQQNTRATTYQEWTGNKPPADGVKDTTIPFRGTGRTAATRYGASHPIGTIMNLSSSAVVPADRKLRNSKGKLVTVICPKCSAQTARRWLYFMQGRCPSCNVILHIGND